jgi:hypothetical protein
MEDPFDLFPSSPPPKSNTAVNAYSTCLITRNSSSVNPESECRMSRTLPMQLAVALGTSRLPSPKPALDIPSATPIVRSQSSELLSMRKENLAQKSNSALLLEALLGKNSAELRQMQEDALTPAQKLMMMHPTPAAAAAATPTAAQATFASVLAAQSGRHLKSKEGEGVGATAKMRNRIRRIDGFIGDMTPTLEHTVEHLLSQGADSNAQDADRNNALWIALQLKGSERVVKMLLEKGAECVEALESEDESSDEEDAQPRSHIPVNENKENREGSHSATSTPVKFESYRPAQIFSSVRAMRKAGAHPSLPQTLRDLQNASGGDGDLFNFGMSAELNWRCGLPLHMISQLILSALMLCAVTVERGSTVDLAMKLGCERHVLMLLRAGHLPHRNGRVRLIEFARLHGFANYATNILNTQLWRAVRDGDESKALDMIRHMDKKLIDGEYIPKQMSSNWSGECAPPSHSLYCSLPLCIYLCVAQDHTGRTALYAAVEHKDPSLVIVESLLKGGANPNHTDISQTPMAVFPLCRAAKKVIGICRHVQISMA